MALGKYFEDNMEIYLERQQAMREKQQSIPLVSLKTVTLLSSHYISVPSSVSPETKNDSLVNARQEKNKSKIISTCKDCGELYIIYEGEQKFFRKHNLHLPKRCRCCRNRRKTA